MTRNGRDRARGFRATLFAGLVAVLSAGCAVELAYDNVDRLARWFASDFVSMDEAQRTRFDQGVLEVWDWHRDTHVPRYAAFLEAVPSVLDDGTSAAEIEAIVNTVIDWALEIEQASLPVAIDLLVSLTDEQVGALGRRMAESNERLAEDERDQTLEESRRAWRKETASRFARLAGALTAAQTAYLDEQSVRYLPDTVLWAEYRGRWQADLMKLLQERADRDRFAQGFRELAANRERYYGAELTQVWANNRALAAEVTAWLVNTRSPQQRNRFNERLAELAAEFRSLSGDAVPGPLPEDLCTVILKC